MRALKDAGVRGRVPGGRSRGRAGVCCVGVATAFSMNETSWESLAESGERTLTELADGAAGVDGGFFLNVFEGVFAGELLVDGGRTETCGESRGIEGVCRATFFSGERSSLVLESFSFVLGEGLGEGFGGFGEGDGLTGPLVFTARLGRGLTGRGVASFAGGESDTEGVGASLAVDDDCVALPESWLVRRFRTPSCTGDGGILDGAVDTNDAAADALGLYFGRADGCITGALGDFESLPLALAAGAGGCIVVEVVAAGFSSGKVASFLSTVGVDDERETRPLGAFEGEPRPIELPAAFELG